VGITERNVGGDQDGASDISSIQHKKGGSSVHRFFRDTKESDGDLGAPAYLYAGPAAYVQHSGERPMRILWRLTYELPADIFHAARVATG
jgi:hypothetical protein